jgi:hypothetical protein
MNCATLVFEMKLGREHYFGVDGVDDPICDQAVLILSQRQSLGEVWMAARFRYDTHMPEQTVVEK